MQTSGAALRVRLRQLHETRRKIPEALTVRIDAQNRSLAYPRARPVPILFPNELRAMESPTGSIYRRAVCRLCRSPGAVTPAVPQPCPMCRAWANCERMDTYHEKQRNEAF